MKFLLFCMGRSGNERKPPASDDKLPIERPKQLVLPPQKGESGKAHKESYRSAGYLSVHLDPAYADDVDSSMTDHCPRQDYERFINYPAWSGDSFPSPESPSPSPSSRSSSSSSYSFGSSTPSPFMSQMSLTMSSASATSNRFGY